MNDCTEAALLNAATNDPLGQMALADWYEERGLSGEAGLLRGGWLVGSPGVAQCLKARWHGGYGGYGGDGGYGGYGGHGGYGGYGGHGGYGGYGGHGVIEGRDD